jgi:hypothetical protein
MTFQQWAATVRDSDEYRDSVRRRLVAGTLPPDVELFLLEAADGRLPASMDAQMADGRKPVSADRPNAPGLRQGPTLALIRPSARTEEV